MIKLSHASIGAMIPMVLLTWWFSGIMDNHYNERMRLQERVWQLEDDCGYTEANKIAFNVTVTTYNPTRRQTDSTPNITADGTRINPRKASSYRYIALSRDLLSRWGGPFNYGDYVIIEGTGKDDGVYQVRDTMNPRFTKRVDILKSKGSKRFKYNSVKLYKHNDKQNDVFAYNN